MYLLRSRLVTLVTPILILVTKSVSCGPIDDAIYLGKFVKKHWNPNDLEMPIKLIVDSRTQVKLNEGIDLPKSGATPIVMWHGMGDYATDGPVEDQLIIQSVLPNIPMLSVQVGENEEDDEFAGFFVDANYQVEEACRMILKNKIIKHYGAFNALAWSQGNQFMRALIERCPLNENGIKVRNYISLGGQHQGVFGLPFCNQKKMCKKLSKLLSTAAYTETLQKRSVQAAYWHDPTKESSYRKKNLFLADINNELQVNEKYKRNLLQLENLVLVKFDKDSMVIPRDSSHFGFFQPGSTTTVLPMEKTALYQEDRIGLKQLSDSGRLHLLTVDGKHLEYSKDWFVDEIALAFLNN